MWRYSPNKAWSETNIRMKNYQSLTFIRTCVRVNVRMREYVFLNGYSIAHIPIKTWVWNWLFINVLHLEVEDWTCNLRTRNDITCIKQTATVQRLLKHTHGSMLFPRRGLRCLNVTLSQHLLIGQRSVNLLLVISEWTVRGRYNSPSLTK